MALCICHPLHCSLILADQAPQKPQQGTSASVAAQSSYDCKFLAGLPNVATEGLNFPLTVFPIWALLPLCNPLLFFNTVHFPLIVRDYYHALPLGALGVMQKKHSL